MMSFWKLVTRHFDPVAHRWSWKTFIVIVRLSYWLCLASGFSSKQEKERWLHFTNCHGLLNISLQLRLIAYYLISLCFLLCVYKRYDEHKYRKNALSKEYIHKSNGKLKKINKQRNKWKMKSPLLIVNFPNILWSNIYWRQLYFSSVLISKCYNLKNEKIRPWAHRPCSRYLGHQSDITLELSVFQ